MGDMLQSSSRVKLNRVALKDVVGVKVAPRRRKVPQPRTDSTKEEDESVLEASGWNKSPRGVLSFKKAAEDGRASPTAAPGGQQEQRVDNNRTNYPGPAGLEGSMRRSTGSFDSVCQESKFSPHPQKNGSKRGLKRPSCDPALGRSKSKKTTAKRSEEREFRTNPKVVLCDFAKNCSACRRGCGVILPKDLKNKAMRCFKQSGPQCWPGCLFHNKPQEQTFSSTARHCLSAVLDGKNIRQVLNEKVGNRQMALGEATALLHSRLRNQVSTSAVASSSKHDSNGNRSTDTSSEGAGPVSDQRNSQAHKRINLGEISAFIRSRHSAAKESKAALKLCKENGHQTDLDRRPSPICEKNHNQIPESFTCQRVNVYIRKAPCSCARTNILWPFGKGHLSSRGPLASSSSEGVVNFSASDSVTESPNQVASSSSAAPPEAPLSKQERGDGMSEGLTNSLHLHSNPTDGDDEERTPSSPANGLETDSPCMTSSTLAFSPPSDTSTHSDPNCLTSPSVLPFSTYLSKKAEDGLKADDASMFPCEASHRSAWGSPSSFTSDNLDSSHSGESPLLFSQDKDQINDCLAGKPALNGNAVHLKSSALCGFLKADCRKTDTNQFLLPTLLSPVASPYRRVRRKSCDEEEHAKDKQSSPECHRLQSQTEGHSSGNSTPGEARTSLWNVEDERDGKEDECDEDGQAAGPVKEDASHYQTKSPAGSPVQTRAPPCVGEEDLPALDEITAYEHDILLLDVNQEDPELFVESPQLSLLRLGPTRASEAPKKTAPAAARVSLAVGGAPGKAVQSLTPVRRDLGWEGQDTAAEGDSRPWRPRCRSTTPPSALNACPTTDEHSRHVVQSDVNNNHADGVLKRMQPIQTVGSSLSIPALLSAGVGPWLRNAAGGANLWRQKSSSYCRQYFSESLACGFKMCRFQHLPVEGDEKFCVETVMRFIKNPACLQKAGAVFSGYYHSSPPGVYFSMQVFLSLLWALLKAGMLSDIFSILRVTLAHNIVPSHEFLLDLFNFVREKSLTGFVPELLQLTVQMVNVGLELSLDCVNHMPLFQQTVHPHPPAAASPHQKSSPSAPLPDCLSLAHAVIEVELCTKQEDWKRMGKVFCSVCQASHHPNQVERISGRIAIALLSESKDRLSLPFAAFVETVFQNDGEGSLVKNFVGRIGVSLMLRYHKTHQWLKGRVVVEIMSASKVNYTTTKGLFGNEDGASRCSLVTVATELFLLSGSVEGALNTLRENAWFLSSCSWPCDPADLENRTRVLKHLAEKTSHRDTLEVLSNLPGIKDPSECSDISKYALLFNSHLQACVDRQILPVASDTVDFMLSKKLAVDHTLLQTLLHKLGKQNLWLRAREVFRHSLRAGHYPGVVAPPGFMTLVIPCGLGEVEQVLTLEMLITVNASLILRLPDSSSSTLSITLTRTNSGESDYLSAGSRLLTAACIPQPKLTIHYTAVNSSQDQVFKLDVSSARRWLRHNHLWASEVWAQ